MTKIVSKNGAARLVIPKRERQRAAKLLAKAIPLREWVKMRPRTFKEIRMAIKVRRALEELAAVRPGPGAASASKER